MAEPENPFEEEGGAEAPEGSQLGLKLLIRLGLMAVVIGIGSVGGYQLGGLFDGSTVADANAQPPAYVEDPIEPELSPQQVLQKDFEYIDFEAITVNLNEPRLERYVRATITLATREKDKPTVLEQLETKNKKKELRSWLHVYLGGLTLEDVRGPKNLNRIRREIEESFNQLLWPNRRPLIDHVLFKEFAVQ
jgi:flagellar basal body-associated protein FliL